MFIVLTAAASRELLTAQQLRLAVGLSEADTSKDALLSSLGTAAASAITNYCRVARDGVTPPTLLQETVSDVFRLDRRQKSLFLSRRFVTSISAVSVDQTPLVPTDYELDRATGVFKRLCGERESCWQAGKVSITYVAGFATVPGDLRMAAQRLVASMYADNGRDPNLKRQRVDGIGEEEYWVGTKAAQMLPQEVADLLSPYLTLQI